MTEWKRRALRLAAGLGGFGLTVLSLYQSLFCGWAAVAGTKTPAEEAMWKHYGNLWSGVAVLALAASLCAFWYLRPRPASESTQAT